MFAEKKVKKEKNEPSVALPNPQPPAAAKHKEKKGSRTSNQQEEKKSKGSGAKAAKDKREKVVDFGEETNRGLFEHHLEEIRKLQAAHQQESQDKVRRLERILEEAATLPPSSKDNQNAAKKPTSPTERFAHIAKLVRSAMEDLELEEWQNTKLELKELLKLEREIREYNNQIRREDFERYVESLRCSIEEREDKKSGGGSGAKKVGKRIPVEIKAKLVYNIGSQANDDADSSRYLFLSLLCGAIEGGSVAQLLI